jgi:O-antigen/teichoic acid export membrane protein
MSRPSVDALAGKRQLADNVVARGLAMAAVAGATLLVARAHGAAAVGVLAMLRVLPGLFGVVASSGLPGAIPYFLGGPDRDDPRLRASLLAIAVVGGVAGTVAWLALSPAMGALFFRGEPALLIAAAGASVLTQLLATTTKACNQGWGDLAGANLVIVLEEALFVPAYLALVAAGLGAGWSVVGALIAADIGAAVAGWARLVRRGFSADRALPSRELAGRICAYGARGQLGGLLNLVNLRLDFAILGAIAGPSTLGLYAVASKCAEVVRVAPLALTYVLYPAMRTAGPTAAARRARQLMPRAGWWMVAAIIPAGIGTITLLPMVYGEEFRPAVLPACILLVGLLGDGIGAVASAFLYATGRPGLNSLAVGAGVVATVVGDLALIPPFAATGAAVASCASYLTTNLVLVACFLNRAPADGAIAGESRRHATAAGSAADGPLHHPPTDIADADRDRMLPPTSRAAGRVALPNGWHVSSTGRLVGSGGAELTIVGVAGFVAQRGRP